MVKTIKLLVAKPLASNLFEATWVPLNEIVSEMNSLKKSGSLINIILSGEYFPYYNSKLQEKGKIEIINYDLICKLEINYIYLINEKQNLKLQILYLKKAKVKKEDKTIEYWVCNDDIAMLLCNQEKYIYYKQPKYLVRTLDEERSTISIISELSELNYVIMNDIDIYSSNTPYFKISDLKSEFDNRTKIKTMKDYLEGINSYNFETILLPDRVKFLRGNIGLEKILRKNKDKFQFYIYNPKIGLTLETLKIMDSFIARSDNNSNHLKNSNSCNISTHKKSIGERHNSNLIEGNETHITDKNNNNHENNYSIEQLIKKNY